MSSGEAQRLAAPERGADLDDLAFIRDRRVGHLATADAGGKPSVVPVVYALVVLDGDPAIAIAIDEKPKGDARALRRVRNILERPEVALVVDDYHEDWRSLAWVLVRGAASLIEPGSPGHAEALTALRLKYPQYGVMRLEASPVILIRNVSTTSWTGSDTGGEKPAERFGREELAALVRGRRSVRAFDTQPVPRPIVEEAIAAAGWAPSPHGRQPWRFVVVESPERRNALADAMAETWRAQLRLDGQGRQIVEARLEKSRDRLQRAPFLIIPCLYLAGLDVYPDPDRQRAEETMAIQSLGAAVQNLLLSLYAAGVDGGWMCAPLFCPDVVQAVLGLDTALKPHALIALGYAASDPVRRPRLPLDELIVDWQ
ncbi:MAG: TIGR03668 family PPOX class F420-dependent oxidoreductase [Chloroflexi bacterium]|nr:TIGR03668 family PPOX class F420-dependent oxidoreductase [Chloroflexota bacterium]